MDSFDRASGKITDLGDPNIYDEHEATISHKYLADILSRSNVKDPCAASERLISDYGSIDAVVSRDADELAGVIGESGAILLKLIAYVDSRRAYDGFRFGRRHTEDEIFSLISSIMLGLSKETVYMVSLDAKGAVVACDMIGEGTVNASDIYPRKLAECAVKRGAVGVYLAHNHPNGTATPSDDDIVATARVFSTLRSAGIKLYAHGVVAGRRMKLMVPDEMTGRIDVIDAF